MSESSYIVKQHGRIVCVLCKLCGEPIRSLVPVGAPVDTRKNGNMVIRDNMMMLGVGANYKQVIMETIKTDHKGKIIARGKHVTCMCSGCLSRANTQDLSKMYTADLLELQNEGQDVKPLLEWRPVRIIGEERV